MLIVEVVVRKLFVGGMVDRKAPRYVNACGVGAIEISTHVLIEIGDGESGGRRNVGGR